MAEPDVDVDAMISALEAERERLAAEFDAIEDDERRAEISATLASIDEQEKRLETRRPEQAQ